MRRLFSPSAYAESVLSIDYGRIAAMGYKAVIFDIDSTLVPHGADTTEEIDELFKYIHKLGLKTLLLSNNSDERIKEFNRNINTLYIPLANKPYKMNYLKAVEMLDLDKSEVLLIGDQLFTDVLGANLCGIDSVLVKFLMHDGEVNIGKKRQVERLMIKAYALNPFYVKKLKNIEKEA